ncbi:hypothetical protein [Treponema sp. Marseille-Q4130]|uniref:hypothetical protein n=1 Tax=Treponema sp. Marseille-Q4130 TaxID=2766702 RepID=UPI001651F447|nr:hypothetical protein [Treponema sp. Marseille-Q4130]MBC6720674.1 hypothetical protein [Treponema sp. Marseille-Q4130]
MDLFDSVRNKNILIQDVGDVSELQRFIGHNVYRRPEPPPDTVDHIDFFAPYFTLQAQERVGINGIYCYSPVLFMLQNRTRADVGQAFAAKRETLQKVFGTLLVFKWETGLNVIDDNYHGVATFYFLGEPIALNNSIVKNTPPAAPLNLNRVLAPNLIKPMQKFFEAAQQAQ